MPLLVFSSPHWLAHHPTRTTAEQPLVQDNVSNGAADVAPIGCTEFTPDSTDHTLAEYGFVQVDLNTGYLTFSFTEPTSTSTMIAQKVPLRASDKEIPIFAPASYTLQQLEETEDVEGTELICALGINDLTTVNLDNDISTTIINCSLAVEGEAVLGIVGNTLVGNSDSNTAVNGECKDACPGCVGSLCWFSCINGSAHGFHYHRMPTFRRMPRGPSHALSGYSLCVTVVSL
jgi:hypothetical protein